jgi:hypothetical protein
MSDTHRILGGIYAEEARQGLRCPQCYYLNPDHSVYCPRFRPLSVRGARASVHHFLRLVKSKLPPFTIK